MSNQNKKPDQWTEGEEPPDNEDSDAAEQEQAEDPVAENARLMNRLMRVTAEFENYRKRKAREKAEWEARALEGLVLILLPVVDSFDRAIASAGEAQDTKAVVEGMKLVHRQMQGALEALGVSPIEARGEPFDPNVHEAFMSRPAAEGEEPGTIVEEVVKGYRLGERTVRPTKGIVAAAEEEPAGSSLDPEEE